MEEYMQIFSAKSHNRGQALFLAVFEEIVLYGERSDDHCTLWLLIRPQTSFVTSW